VQKRHVQNRQEIIYVGLYAYDIGRTLPGTYNVLTLSAS